MDAVRSSEWDTVVVMSSAQVGKTEIVNNIVGYHIHQDACPMLVIHPTLDMAETWSKDRLAPMIRDTPVLTGKIADPKSRAQGNTIRHKTFPGGHLTAAGANSPASLASRPVRLVLCDEVDRYPPSAGTEGDPVLLAFKRSTAFWNRIRVMVSTPTVKGRSRIESAWEESTKDRFHVPCPHCGHEQHLKWAQVKWDKDNGEHRPETARYTCESCQGEWTDAQRWAAVREGEWVSENPLARVKGFHLNEIYSTWVSLETMVADFLQAKKLPETLKTWINTALGETYEEAGESVDPETLYASRREHYADGLTDQPIVITAGIDQQKDRLECEVLATAENGESWNLDYRAFPGSMDNPERGAWKDLDDYLKSFELVHKSGVTLKISAAAVDTGGIYTSEAYAFCKKRWARRIFAIKGRGGHGLPIIANQSSANSHRVRLYSLGVDTLKAQLYARLNEIHSPGPGYCHFPIERDEKYFEGLTSEKAVTRYPGGRPTIRFEPKPGTVQEPLDCRVYATGALFIANPNWKAIGKRFEVEPEPELPDDAPPKKTKRRGRKASNWVKNF